jgi:hypothetical protein
VSCFRLAGGSCLRRIGQSRREFYHGRDGLQAGWGIGNWLAVGRRWLAGGCWPSVVGGWTMGVDRCSLAAIGHACNERLPTSVWLMGSPLFLRRRGSLESVPFLSPARPGWDGETDFSGMADLWRNSGRGVLDVLRGCCEARRGLARAGAPVCGKRTEHAPVRGPGKREMAGLQVA